MKLWLLPFLLLFPFAALGQPVTASAGPYRISIASDPAVVPVGNAKLRLQITDTSGKAADGLSVKVLAQMPSMPMGEREQTATPLSGSPGTYEAPATFAMAGTYGAHITIEGPYGKADTTVSIETGQDTSGAAATSPYPRLAVLLAFIALTVWVAFRAHKVGITPNFKAAAAPGVVLPLALLIAIFLGAVWVVNNLRRPGAMTPLAAQAMEMNTPAPPGSLAVTISTVSRKTIDSTVRYTGQVAGFAEQDVYPRVTGTLIYMPFYVGNRVRKGEVLARLDTTQLTPQVDSRKAMAAAAANGFTSAQEDDKAAAAMVDQANAEHEQYMDAIQEAQSTLASAKENQAAMAAQITAAQADVQSAEARRASAQADATYWAQELRRIAQVYEAGGVSLDRYQQELSQESKARAVLNDMASQVSAANARLQAAIASQKQAAASTAAAENKVNEANHAMLIHRAHVANALASRASLKAKAAQALAQANEAQAELSSAIANESYATIRSEVDGVVTQRLVTQGTLVQPGMSILKVAQIDPIRVQANVPTSDLGHIRLGSRVRVWTGDDNGKALDASITSISPDVDPTARTGVAEAIVPNRDKKLLPGQYDALEISTGRSADALVVASEAIQEGPGGSFVWVAAPTGSEGTYTVRRQTVKTGPTDGTDVAILAGLKEGQTVVTSGFINLEDGATVNAESAVSVPIAMNAGASATTVQVTPNSFQPGAVEIPAGSPKSISFLRKTNATCATQILIPALGVKRDLPLNQLTTIDLSKAKPGNYEFTCGLSMLKGQVAVK